ncbi:MAG: hypothetical protein ACRD8W_27815 [Nitrososphaeraceae archaeon]
MSIFEVEKLGIILSIFSIGIMTVQMFALTNNINMLLAYPPGLQAGNSTFGTISSVQNNENGVPFWIVSGHWKTNVFDLVNQSQVLIQENVSGQQGTSEPVFNTSFRMITLNGTGEHTHTITNFVLKDISMPNNMTIVFNGTSTASLREGPVTDIPTTIKAINDKVISIWLDPSKINGHYGNTPVYGIIMDKTDFRQPNS